jgi:hypothetical protein
MYYYFAYECGQGFVLPLLYKIEAHISNGQLCMSLLDGVKNMHVAARAAVRYTLCWGFPNLYYQELSYETNLQSIEIDVLKCYKHSDCT